ncbi:hypothetical protein [Paenibacillus xylanilyticus]|uniref:Uncharacterized protein n=1 Tax=Paenibacillus xylanilyticus TaxID=248903 RepID=A0A7Y6BT89_9BACL|nr:hypothetical protein [Paenibacillus xylanilyticus]NUU74592.1 hypothetical protein [Paenibacillus xylanilyticus]
MNTQTNAANAIQFAINCVTDHSLVERIHQLSPHKREQLTTILSHEIDKACSVYVPLLAYSDATGSEIVVNFVDGAIEGGTN